MAPTTAEISPLRRALTEPIRARTWRETAWAVVALPIGIIGATCTVAALWASGLLIITFVGLPLLALTGLLSRHAGSALRRFGNRLLGADIPPAQPFRARPGVFGWLGSCLSDGTAWRARLYLFLKLPLGVLSACVAVAFLAYGVGGTFYAAYRPFLPCQHDSNGTCVRGLGNGPSGRIIAVHPLGIVVVTIIGLALLFVAPWAVRATVALDKSVMRALLGPTTSSQRVEQLQRTRAAAVDDSAATLRRIERDLHDGAQAQLVSLAMNVGLAREKLAEGGDPAQAVRLLDTAHATAKRAITDLRDLARGIHPPVLDAGLDAAIATLAAHSPVPVTLDVIVDERPEPSIETMVYFCAAELLTNVAKHSGAQHATVTVRTTGGELILTVHDDGHGGAQYGNPAGTGSGAGSGLAGLAERVATVDGRLSLDSPAGGPTTASVHVPLRAGSTR